MRRDPVQYASSSSIPSGEALNTQQYFRFAAALLVATALTACQTHRPAPSVETHYAQAVDAVERAESELIDFRHDLHRHPELSGQEQRTARQIAQRLLSLGFDVRTHIGGHGVVGVLTGDGPDAADGPVIAFRADMDASRDTAFDPVPYASTVPGVRHNCGHDLHSTIGIALAAGFAAIRDDLPGQIMLIFQPAEESGTGARAMLADQVFADSTPDAILAVHTFPMDVGVLATRSGALLAGRTQISVNLTGSGDLEAAATRVREAILGVSTVSPAQALQPAEPGFVYIDLAPPRRHPVDRDAVVNGYAMSADINQRVTIQRQISNAVMQLHLTDIQVDISFHQALEGATNDARTVDLTTGGIDLLTDGLSLQPAPEVYPAFSEDFGAFQQQVPGAMFFLGVNNPQKGTIGFPHSPDYVADDGAIVIGARAMLAAMLTLMDRGRQLKR